MKHLVFFFILFPTFLQAQVKFDYTWILGDNLSDTTGGKYWGAILDFKETPPELDFFQIPIDLEATAMISDSSGNLLFYTNGCVVINRKHEMMANGDSINVGGLVYEQNCDYKPKAHGYPAHQGVLILPWPGRPEMYMMLHLHRPGGPGSGKYNHNLLYTTIDMTLDGGYGAVTQKNTLIFQDTFPGDFLTAARHGNGRDWWILLPKFNSPLYYSFLLSPQGISGPYVQENIALPVDVGMWGSQAAFSPNGKIYATASYTAGLQVFDFDRCTGKLSNKRNLEEGFKGSAANGVAFSPNSHYLYVSANGEKLYQFDMKADSLLAGQTLVGVYDSFGMGQGGSLPTNFYQQMLAPDGKIYMTTPNGTKYLHVIHKPNELGLACDFEQRGLELSTSHSFSPPNFPHFRLYDFQDSPCDTLSIDGPPPPEDTTPPPPKCAASIRIFPNPTQNIAYLELPDCQGGSLSVFDVTGRWVEDLALTPESLSTSLDVSRYVPGVYFLRIRTAAGEKVTRRLVVVR